MTAAGSAPLVLDGLGVYSHVILLAAGIGFLYLGAEALVASASRLAVGLGLDAAIIGVTVVAFATTAPEMFVGLFSSIDYTDDLGLGAIIGSNIANVGLVLGIAALIRPFDVDETVFRRHMPFMVLAAAALVGLGFDNVLSRLDGGLMLALLAAFTVFLYRESRNGNAIPTEDVDTDSGEGYVLLLVVGLALLLIGSRWLIQGGRGVLVSYGFGNRIIGLTVLAFGTSLPELAASVVSAVRGKAAFSLGNVVGSNIYNILAVVGTLALLVPLSVSPDTVAFDFPALIAFTLVIVALLFHDTKISRLDGGILIGCYGVFFYFLV